MSTSVRAPVSYAELLRTNPAVRRVWWAQVVSELGDWLNLVALFQIVAVHSHRAEAAGWILIIQLLPWVVWSPVAGVVADRFDRRRVMIAADLLRAAVVLGFLAVDRPERLWLLYALAGVQFSLTAFFEPARSALLPTIAEGEALLTANALGGVTWSVMLAIGGAFGGLISGLLSPEAAFVVDSCSFLCSAAILVGLRGTGAGRRVQTGGTPSGIGTALALLRGRPRLRAVLLVKAGLALSGGGLWLLTLILGQRVFPIGEQGVISVGLFYGAHGLGAIVGAAMTGRLCGLSTSRSIRAILGAFVLRAAFFWLMGAASEFSVALLATAGVAACGSLLWVASTTLLQSLTTDDVRGRLFSLELGGLTLALSAALWVTGASLDRWHVSPHVAAFGTAGVGAVVAALWGVAWLRWPSWARFEPDRRTRPEGAPLE